MPRLTVGGSGFDIFWKLDYEMSRGQHLVGSIPDSSLFDKYLDGQKAEQSFKKVLIGFRSCNKDIRHTFATVSEVAVICEALANARTLRDNYGLFSTGHAHSSLNFIGHAYSNICSLNSQHGGTQQFRKASQWHT